MCVRESCRRVAIDVLALQPISELPEIQCMSDADATSLIFLNIADGTRGISISFIAKRPFNFG